MDKIKKQAFTMAEAILVMTILGIIATIMITTLKPAEFKDKGLKIMAKKVLSEIDTATTQILINNSQNGTMSTLYNPSNSTIYQFKDNAHLTGVLYKKYLTATRQATNGTYCSTGTNSFFLKDGACMGIKSGNANYNTWFPGENNFTAIKPTQGAIYVDINGDEEPNIEGKDRFVFPIDDQGIQYSE